MSEAADRRRPRYTWADYQTWADDQRWEIIDGAAYQMSPSPTSRHQRIVGELYAAMHPWFKGNPCQLFIAPMDVVLAEDDVVQPDLLVVCDPGQVRRTHIAGAPALAVEVLSESSLHRDRLLKTNLYARHGVKEFWLVTPWPSMVEVLLLRDDRYELHAVLGKDQTLASPSFPGLRIALVEIFDFPLEPGEEPPMPSEPPAPKYGRQAG